MSERFAGLELPEAIDIGLGSERVLDGRSLAPDEIEADAHGLERQKQVGKEDGGIELDAANRLHRHLGGQIRRPADIEKGIALPQGTIFGHVAAGLSHEPDGRRVNRLQTTSSEEPGPGSGQEATLSI